MESKKHSESETLPEPKSENYDELLKLEITPDMDKAELAKLRSIVKSEQSHF